MTLCSGFSVALAYVSPPPRPGAELWGIAAGPLVNVVLIPIFSALVSVSSHLAWYDTYPDLYDFLHNVWWINVGLLIFNMMPVYPLDGGQILRALLWFPLGRVTSLFVATIVGFVGLAVLLVLTALIILFYHDLQAGGWLALIAFFIATRSWSGLKQARALARVAKIPRREGFACPTCKTAPPLGALWRCGKCGQPFDTFLSNAACPHCGTQYSAIQCLDCGSSAPIGAWSASSAESGMRS